MSLKRGASEWAVGNWLVAAALMNKLVEMVWRAVSNWEHGFFFFFCAAVSSVNISTSKIK